MCIVHAVRGGWALGIVFFVFCFVLFFLINFLLVFSPVFVLILAYSSIKLNISISPTFAVSASLRQACKLNYFLAIFGTI